MGAFVFSGASVSALDFTATGAEGMTLVLPALIGATVLLLTYNSVVFVPENPVTDSSGYMFNTNTGTFTFGLNLQPQDIIQILYEQ